MQEISKKRNLNNLAEYQNGSIVSKAILAKKGGNITLFAFDKNEGLSEHTAPFDAFVYLLDGKAEITISGDIHLLSTGEMIIMPANKPHALKAVESFKMLLVMIKSE
jgi:quercetin dioxygenase-like cupin family protein